MSNLVKGTAILTIGLFLSKALGLFYVIPFYAIIGKENIGLYQYAYIPYNLALAVAISGAPLAISKFVSKYNAAGDFATGRKLMKSGMFVMAVSGFLSFLVLFFLAEPIARIVIASKGQNYTVEEVTTVIKWGQLRTTGRSAHEHHPRIFPRVPEVRADLGIPTC